MSRNNRYKSQKNIYATNKFDSLRIQHFTIVCDVGGIDRVHLAVFFWWNTTEQNRRRFLVQMYENLSSLTSYSPEVHFLASWLVSHSQ
jgi:hypothetical protein